MKIEGNTATVESTLGGGETHRCDLDPSGLAQLVYALTNLYSDVKAAVIREYVANGVDSHRRAGQAAPVEVTLPGGLSPTLQIRDQGVGMSRDDIITTYGRYLSSTKRDDPHQIGWFGLGAKSAFTVTTQFTVEAVKNGWRAVILFHLGTDGVPSYTFVAHEQTGGTDGVTVTIPTDPGEAGEWRTAARAVCGTMPAGLVRVDGREPASVLTDSTRIDERVWCLRDGRRGLSVVMGGLRYQVPDDAAEYAIGGLVPPDRFGRTIGHLVVDVDLGQVDLTPSREAVRDTRRTRQALREALAAARGRIMGRYRREVLTLPGTARVLAHNAFLGQDSDLILTRIGAGIGDVGKVTSASYAVRYPGCGWSKGPVEAARVGTGLTLVVCGPEGLGRVRHWVKNNPLAGGDTTVVVADSETGRDGWLSWGVDGSPVRVVTLDELVEAGRAARPPKPKAAPRPKAVKAEATYQVVAAATGSTSATVLGVAAINGLDGPVVVVPGGCPRHYQWPEELSFLHSSGTNLVFRGGRGDAATRARIPGAVGVREAVKDAAARAMAGVDPVRAGDASRVSRNVLVDAARMATGGGFVTAARILSAWAAWVDVPKEAAVAARLVGRPGGSALLERLPALSGVWLQSGPLLALLDVADVSRVMPPDVL